MGGMGDVEENENKIIRKISKMVLIDKWIYKWNEYINEMNI
jgi:hypothetical protein